jgi:hypothetical protein
MNRPGASGMPRPRPMAYQGPTSAGSGGSLKKGMPTSGAPAASESGTIGGEPEGAEQLPTMVSTQITHKFQQPLQRRPQHPPGMAAYLRWAQMMRRRHMSGDSRSGMNQ